MSAQSVHHPIIIIGMHRSGTSLIAKMLSEIGIFMGRNLDGNHEPSFFTKLNSWLLSSAGGRWDTPSSLRFLYEDEKGTDLAVEYLRHQASSVRCFRYLGASRFLRYRSLFRVSEHWGWKDPRTTLTLPLWLRVFPEAKVIHVIRNGVDVAESLQRRQKAGFHLAEKRFRQHRVLMILHPKQGWFGTSPRVTHRADAFHLWEEYLLYAEKSTHTLSKKRFLQFRYEDFVSMPSKWLERLMSFCEIGVKNERIRQLVDEINPNRAFAFKGNDKTNKFYDDVRDTYWMQLYGYHVVSD